MALVFPRLMTDQVAWRSGALSVQYRQELAPTVGSAVGSRDLGDPVWRADFRSVALPLAVAQSIEADFATLGRSMRTFYATPADRPAPVEYNETDHGASVVTVEDIRPDRSEMKLIGFTSPDAGNGDFLQWRRGDFFSVQTSTGVELLQMQQDFRTWNSTGTQWFSVSPMIRPSIQIGDPVTLVNPLVELRLEPDGFAVTDVDPAHRIVSFSAVQVVR